MQTMYTSTIIIIYFSSTLLFKNNAFTYGPNTPKRFESHCVTPVNETHTFLAGGSYGVDFEETTEREAWMYDWERSQWTRVENMITPAFHNTLCHRAGNDIVGKVNLILWLITELDHRQAKWSVFMQSFV